jgi:hypothetical protein
MRLVSESTRGLWEAGGLYCIVIPVCSNFEWLSMGELDALKALFVSLSEEIEGRAAGIISSVF